MHVNGIADIWANSQSGLLLASPTGTEDKEEMAGFMEEQCLDSSPRQCVSLKHIICEVD